MKRSGPPARRTPLARGASVLRRVRLRPQSDKKTDPQRAAARALVLGMRRSIARDTCEAAALVPHVACWHPASARTPLDGHEVIPRSVWPDGDLSVDNVRMVCRAHHDWIGEHPDEAHAVGLHGYSWERRSTP